MAEVEWRKGRRSQGSLNSLTSSVPPNLEDRELHPTRAGRGKPLHCTKGETETWRWRVQKLQCWRLEFSISVPGLSSCWCHPAPSFPLQQSCLLFTQSLEHEALPPLPRRPPASRCFLHSPVVWGVPCRQKFKSTGTRSAFLMLTKLCLYKCLVAGLHICSFIHSLTPQSFIHSFESIFHYSFFGFELLNQAKGMNSQSF